MERWWDRDRLDDVRLRLRHVDDAATHAADEHHAPRGLALHEVLGDGDGEQVSAVDVDGPELAHAVDRVVDGIVVLGEAGTGDEVVDLAVLLDDLVDASLDRVGVGHVGVMGRHLGYARRPRVFLAEELDQLDGLFLGFFLYRWGWS